MTAQHHRAATLPPVNTTVMLELVELGREVTSRVEDLDDEPASGGAPQRLLVAAPRVAGSLAWERDGAAVDVRWVTPRGLCLVPCELERRIPGRLPLWLLRAVAPAVVDQRRRYARAVVPATARLAVAGSTTAENQDGAVTSDSGSSGGPVLPPVWVDVQLRDLSERGARLEPAAGSSGALEVVEGTEVVLEIVASGETVAVSGVVLRVEADRSGTSVVLELEPSEQVAATIRRAVLAAQIDARGLPGR